MSRLSGNTGTEKTASPRKIAVVTGSRAEFGILTPLLQILRDDGRADLQLIVTASHLVPAFGMTVDEIENAGIPIAERVEMLLTSDTPGGIIKSMGVELISLADVYRRLAPDILVLLGDRYEILAAATAALVAGIPVAHIHGGEVTEGAIDDSIRHAVTKISRFHFTATEAYRRRVIQLGEDPDTVFCVGAPGLDRLVGMELLPSEAIKEELRLDPDRPIILVTYHPVTAAPAATETDVTELLNALDEFPEYTLVFTRANADHQGRLINARLERYVATDPLPVVGAETRGGTQRRHLFSSLGSLRYLSLAAAAAVVVGNSSSGILEIPFLGVPSIDIGERQRGRIRPASVIHTTPDRASIVGAIQRAVENGAQPEPRENNPYYCGGASAAIAERLVTTEIPGTPKRFYDVHQ